MARIGILTSGGDSQGMNSAIRAITRTALVKGYEVVGVKEGYKGLMEKNFIDLKTEDVAEILHKGGTILQTARSLDFTTIEGQTKAIQNLKEKEIEHLVVIGGDGSYRGALALNKLGVSVYGLPGTIDNDIPLTDYTVGFDTAVNIVTDAVLNIRDTSSSHNTIMVVEVMGRNCGDIALQAGIASGADAIIIPEVEYDLYDIAQSLIQGFKKGKTHGIVVLAEGAGKANEIAKRLETLTKYRTRFTNLGYIQRGGTPTAFDRVLTSRMGNEVFELIERGITGVAIGIENNSITYHPFEKVLGSKNNIDLKLYDIAKNLI